MQGLRKKLIRSFLTFITGILFLNMGFFLFEVRLLGLHNDPLIMANVSKMIAGAAFEEERDSSSQNTNLAEEEYIAGHNPSDHHANLFLIRRDPLHLLHDGTCHHGYYKRFNPPPEV
jgi:hypothetical protein